MSCSFNLSVCNPSVFAPGPGAGMVVDWEQETGLLMTSGDVRIIRIWDTEREMKVQVGGRTQTHILRACYPHPRSGTAPQTVDVHFLRLSMQSSSL